jgi:hypothetical protein
MLNICGSNLIPILITILCCAGLFMYFNLRLAEIKMAVEKQNRVLTSFITNVQQDICGGGGGCNMANNLAAPEALVAAKNFDIERENDKIVVSDDEEDDDDDDSSDDSDEDNEDIHTIQVIDLPVERMSPISFEVFSLPTEVLSLNAEVLSLPTEMLSSFGSISESSITEIIDESLNLIPTTTPSTEQSYEQMKVDELRKIVSDKNLASKEEVKKLKKPELLVLLKK